jgi:ABC-type uncharacterized transport system ATPase component
MKGGKLPACVPRVPTSQNKVVYSILFGVVFFQLKQYISVSERFIVLFQGYIIYNIYMYVTQNINSTNIISIYTIQISNTNKKWELN